MFYKICTESRSNSPTALKVGAEIGIDYERTTVLALWDTLNGSQFYFLWQRMLLELSSLDRFRQGKDYSKCELFSLTTIPVMSPDSNLRIATSSAFCSAVFTRWPIRRFRSIDLSKCRLLAEQGVQKLRKDLIPSIFREPSFCSRMIIFYNWGRDKRLKRLAKHGDIMFYTNFIL